MYQGSTDGAIEYFNGINCSCPPNTNPADHYMDVIGGTLLEINPKTLFEAWDDHESAGARNTLANRASRSDNIRANPGTSCKAAFLFT